MAYMIPLVFLIFMLRLLQKHRLLKAELIERSSTRETRCCHALDKSAGLRYTAICYVSTSLNVVLALCRQTHQSFKGFHIPSRMKPFRDGTTEGCREPAAVTAAFVCTIVCTPTMLTSVAVGRHSVRACLTPAARVRR